LDVFRQIIRYGRVDFLEHLKDDWIKYQPLIIKSPVLSNLMYDNFLHITKWINLNWHHIEKHIDSFSCEDIIFLVQPDMNRHYENFDTYTIY